MADSRGPDSSEDIPEHVRESADTASEVNRQHQQSATAYDRCVDEIIRALSRPIASGLVFAAILLWVIGNIIMGTRGFDPWPFNLLSAAVSVSALLTTILILTSQRRAARLSDQREQLLLQFARINDAKVSKLVEMMQQLREDHPEIVNAEDPQAVAMAQPVDTAHLLDVHTADASPNP